MRRRGEGGFQRAGGLGAAHSGLPGPLARKLELDAAWRDVAGPLLAARARADQIRRGVLELKVDDPAWARQVVPLLPLLAAKLARRAPGLGIRKFKISVAGEVRVPPTLPPIHEDAPAWLERPAELAGAPPATAPAHPADDPAASVSKLAERYLAAVTRRRPSEGRG